MFDYLNDIQEKIIIQPNRCQFILSQLSKRYDCPFIHIIRNPIDVWFSQTIEMFALADDIKRAKIILRLSKINIFRIINNTILRYILVKYLHKQENLELLPS